jgi:ABC-type glycerol-3-phosphate transport system substrate-binding protein
MQRITRSALTRRQVLAGSALAATAVPIAHVSAQGSAGRVACGFWDHWVPAGNGALRELCTAWGQKERVDVQVDFITSVGRQNELTIAAQAQSKSGHDILSFPTWFPAAYAEQLEPVDDVVGRLIAQHGPVTTAAEYLAKRGGKWVAVPAVSGTQMKPCLARIDHLKQHAGIDVQAMWPAEDRAGPGADAWTWDAFLTAAEKCNAAGVPFGLPMGSFSDAVDWVGALFTSFGASMLDANGAVTVRNNPKLRAAVDYMVRLAKVLPNDVWAWDDASNNRAIQSGRSALIFNPPSAYAVARRDNMAGHDQQWTFPMPSGPEGRFVPYLPYFWGIWNFSRSKAQSKSLLEFLSSRESAEKQTTTSAGYDIPPFPSMSNFNVWKTEGPPTGVVFNYPLKAHHNARTSVAFQPAPAEIAVQAYTQGINTGLIARIAQGGQTVDQAMAWAERELRNFARG